MANMSHVSSLSLSARLADGASPCPGYRWIGQTAGNSAVGEYLIKLAQRFGWKTMSVVRREAAAEQVRRWGGDRVVIDDDKLESNLAQSLSDTELDIVVEPRRRPRSAAARPPPTLRRDIGVSCGSIGAERLSGRA
jgi:trans-2-enoyl-CoA reductase